MMNILLLTDSDAFAGTERHMLDLAVALREQGATALVGCPVPGRLAERAAGAGLEVVPVPKGGGLARPAIKTVSGLLESGRVRVVHAHNGRSALVAAAAVSRARVGRCVATQHFLDPSRLGRRGVKGVVSRLAHRWVDRRMSHYIAISEAVRRGMLDRGEVTADRVTVIHNGLPDPAAEALPPPEQVREQLGIERGAPLIVCAARLEREKDVGTLVEAMRPVAAVVPAALCAIAGEGAERTDLTERIAAAGLERNIRLLGFRPDVLALINAADLFVLPSLAEPFGLVIVEAMGLSKPVIATNAGGPREIVEGGRTGLLVPPREPGAMGAAVLRLLADDTERHRMGEAGRRRYAENFTARRMAAATLGVYERVTAGVGRSLGARPETAEVNP